MSEKISNHFTLENDVKVEVKKIIDSVLNKVPTGGNSKPFTWEWIGNVIHVRHNQNHAKHYLNRNNHTSKISFGCLIESLQIVCVALSMKYRIHINQEDLSLILTIEGLSSSEFRVDQISKLLKRSTYRGVMSTKSKNSSIDLDEFDGVFVSRFPSLNLINYLKVSANYIWHQQLATIDFFKEIRFFSKIKSSEMRGIPTSELSLPPKDLVALKIFSLMPKLLIYLMKFKPIERIFLENTRRLLEASDFVVICAPSTSTSDLIQAGRRALNIWLDLENQGFSVQPLSAATLPLVDAVNGVLPADTHPAFRKLYEEQGLTLLKKEFSINEALIPIWLFRVGNKLEE